MHRNSASLARSIGCIQASYITMQCLSTSFFVQAYQRFGIDKMTISLIVMLCNATGIIFQPVWGHFVDRSNHPRETVLACCGFSVVCYFVLMYSRGTVWLITLMAMLFYATFHCMMTLIDSWVAKLIRGGLEVNYGQTRSIGCVVYAVVAVAFGALVTRFGQLIAPYCFGLVFIILCSALVRVPNPKDDSRETSKVSIREMIGYLMGNKAYLIVVSALFLSTFTSFALSTFFSVHVFELGGNELIVGIGTFFMAISEFPFMFLFTTISKRLKWSSMTALVVAMIFYSAHAFLLGSVRQIGQVIAVSVLHGLSYGIYQPAKVMFVVENVESRYIATAQMLMNALGQSLPAVLASPVSGAISTVTSTGAMLRMIAAFSLVGAIVIVVGRRLLRGINIKHVHKQDVPR